MVEVAEAVAQKRHVARMFSGQRQQAFAAPDDVGSPDGQAALRQLSVERLMAYGVHHADTLELRGRVWSGEPWQDVAADLAEACLSPPEASVSPPSQATRINRLYRGSALVRMSQMMMLSNSAERSAIYARAAGLYAEAAALSGDREKVLIPTDGGLLVGWIFPSRGKRPVGTAVVIGGVEGWAMDFSDLGLALARRGVETLLLDGPGQGESRMIHGHFLTKTWERSYAGVFDFMASRYPGLPMAFIGNSMGGALAIHLAAREPRIVACCDNGGPMAPRRPPGNASFFQKMTAHCGEVSEEQADEIWQTVKPADPTAPIHCPLLIVQGGLDPLVSNGQADYLFSHAMSEDKELVVFSDGDHCVYNHADDKHNLIGDWIADRLTKR